MKITFYILTLFLFTSCGSGHGRKEIDVSEQLFINAYYKTLKETLRDKAMRKRTLNYLNEVKNHYANN